MLVVYTTCAAEIVFLSEISSQIIWEKHSRLC